jgi:hypothetical protein
MLAFLISAPIAAAALAEELETPAISRLAFLPGEEAKAGQPRVL